jgi:hypothetical protein
VDSHFRGNDGHARSKGMGVALDQEAAHRGKAIIRSRYHSIPRNVKTSDLLGMHRLGHGDARYVVAQLFVECLRPVVVAEHV